MTIAEWPAPPATLPPATSADFAADANAAVRLLQSRPEIDRDAIGLVGHSEGGIVAPIAAAIHFVILLAGPGNLAEVGTQNYEL